MRTFLKSFGNGSPEDLARLEELSLTLEAQKQSLEHLVSGTAATLGQLQQFAAVADRIGAAERRLAAVEGIATQLDLAEGKLAGLSSSQLRIEGRIGESQTGLDRLKDELTSLSATASRAATEAADVTTRVGETRSRLDALAAAAEQLRNQGTDLGDLSERIDALDARIDGHGERLDGIDRKATEQTDALNTLRPLVEAAGRDAAAAAKGDDLRRELGALRQELQQVKAARQQAAADDAGLRGLVEARDQQVTLLERRLAHADTLLADLQSTLEALVAQKVQVDHLLERASAVPMETRRVEALLDALREERRASDRLCLALSELRHKQAGPAATPRPEPAPAAR